MYKPKEKGLAFNEPLVQNTRRRKRSGNQKNLGQYEEKSQAWREEKPQSKKDKVNSFHCKESERDSIRTCDVMLPTQC